MAKKVKAYGREYMLEDGTYYSKGTSPEMVKVLENLRKQRKRVTFRFGDPKTGGSFPSVVKTYHLLAVRLLPPESVALTHTL